MKRQTTPEQAFHIIRKPVPSSGGPAEAKPAPAEIDTARAAASALSIALMMKRRQQEADRAKAAETAAPAPAGNPVRNYSADELALFRDALLASRDALVVRAEGIKENVGFSAEEEIESDGGDGTNQTMRLDALRQVEESSRSINAIDEALREIEGGTYGICAACGGLIAKERLLQSPFVKTCTACQQAFESRR